LLFQLKKFDLFLFFVYNARGILFVDDSNHTRFFQYHKIPISGRFLKVTSERDIPVCQQAILSYWKKQSCLLLIDKIEPNPYYFFCKYNAQAHNGRQKIKIGQTFLTGKAINSEIIIDDIEVIVDNKGDSIFGEVKYTSCII
jgi:hypothetical protein